jgi:predicted dienelactone hydrolase
MRAPLSAPAVTEVIDGTIERPGRGGQSDLVRVRQRRPATPPPWPLLVYSHGLGGSLASGGVWTEAWSALGFLCVHVLHAATSQALFDPASADQTHRRVTAALAHDHTAARCAEVTAVLDHLLAPGHELAGRIDASLVVVAGHSYGALTAMALAGRRLPQPPSGPLADPRIHAAIVLSPGVNPVSRGESMAAVRMPVLCVTGSLDEQVEIGVAPRRVRAGVPLAHRLAVYRGLPPARRMLLFVEGADHMTFAGEPVDTRFFGRAPGWDEARERAHHAVVAARTGGFLRRLRAATAAPAAAPWPPARETFAGGVMITGHDWPGPGAAK